MLLLVDDDEAEVLERHALAQHRMGADHDIDRAVGDAGPGLLLVGGGDHAGDLHHVDRQAGEAGREGFIVLPGQQRGRHHHGHLGAVDGSGKGRAQRDFRLAEADVAADQAVHRVAGFEVFQNRLDRAGLVLRLLVGEAGAEFVVGAERRHEFLGGLQGPFGRDLDQPMGDLADAVLHPGLAALPAGAP